MMQSAIIHEITVIGEATRRISDHFRRLHNEIPWKQMVGMRDVLVHDYDEIILEEVWRTSTVNIPDLIRQLRPLLPPRT